MTTTTIVRLLIAGLVVVLAACGQSSTSAREAAEKPYEQAQPGLTETEARIKIVEYLTQTLGHLPQQTSLSRDHPTSPYAHQEGHTIPCVDEEYIDNPPYLYDVTYWVVGVPSGEAEHYQSMVREAWRKMNWPAGRLDVPAMVQTPDYYLLDVQVNPSGDLYIVSGSPCFSAATVEGKQVPLTIPHPPPGGTD